MSDKFKSYWIAHQILDHVASISTTIFINFYIWENTKNISSILRFNLGLFLVYPLAVLLSSLLIELLGLKFTQIITKIYQGIFVFLLLIIGIEIIHDPLVFGLLSGIVFGAAFAPIDVITAKTPPDLRLDINSKIKTGTIMAGLIVPPLLSILVDSSGSFVAPFILALVIYFLLFVYSVLVIFPDTDGKFSLKEIFTIPGDNPEKGILLKTAFLTGLKESIHYSLIGVLTLNFIGSLTGWGWFRLTLSLFSLFLVLIYKKLKIAKQSIISLGFGAIIFLVGSAYFAHDFSLMGIYVYAAAFAVYEVFFGFGINNAMARLTDLDVSKRDLTPEYTFFTSLFTSFGLVLPILFLDSFRLNLEDPLLFQLVVIFIALVPFTILKVMSKSFYLTHQS